MSVAMGFALRIYLHLRWLVVVDSLDLWNCFGGMPERKRRSFRADFRILR